MGFYKKIRELWKKPKANMPELTRERLIQWRKEDSTVRIQRPTRLDRARSLGYRAKPGFVIVRQKVSKGGHKRPKIKAGRRSAHSGQTMTLKLNYKAICERRAAKKYINCEVLNSYWVGEDGKQQWYEVILVDRTNPSILADKKINWISTEKNRALRGLTSAQKKSRGLRKKGKGAEKMRPSRRAHQRQG
ncbi:50S ribosomal protein L15e [Candidatus Woesearchaeota archaeon]|nr:50S ribosomal protein L15e [Candidatus Woesearchaeota archaeon]